MLSRYFERIKMLDYLIKIKATGSPTQLARRLAISESTLYEYLACMKRHGAPISYCKHRCSYYYEEEGCFNLDFNRKLHDDNKGES